MKPRSSDSQIEQKHRNNVSAAPCKKPLGPKCRPTRFGHFSRMIENFRSKLMKNIAHTPNKPNHVKYNRVRKPKSCLNRRESFADAIFTLAGRGGRAVIG
jgi:hypothetical protein